METKRLWERGGGYPLVIVGVAAVAAACWPFRGQLDVQAMMLIYVPVVVAAARFFGTRQSASASVLAVLVLDVLFTRPYYHLAISNTMEWFALGIFLVCALIAGQQTGHLREREQAALRRQRELALLNRLSFHIVSNKSVQATAELIVAQVMQLLAVERVALYACEDDEAARLLAFAGGAVGRAEGDFVAWVCRSDKAIGLPDSLGATEEPRPVSVGVGDAIPSQVADGVYLPLQTTGGLEGVLYARALPDGAGIEEDVRFLVAVGNLAGAALERKRLEAEAASLAAEREADVLKSTIISSVSHELKTPLAAAVARVSSLLDEGASADSDRVRKELGAVSGDLARLESSIVDLLDVARLESDAWRPQPDLYEVSEILGSVFSRLPSDQRVRVDFDIVEPVPYVYVDFSQMMRALANIVDNALIYSPALSRVSVTVSADGEDVLIAIEDRGPGIDDAEKGVVFDKFVRGAAAATSPGGTGLGLAIAREIVESQGGRIRIEDAQPTGARFVVSLPLAVIGTEAE